MERHKALEAGKERLEASLSGAMSEISRMQEAAEKQKEAMERLRKQELDLQCLLQERDAQLKEASITFASTCR